jgi:hypothetical protein
MSLQPSLLPETVCTFKLCIGILITVAIMLQVIYVIQTYELYHRVLHRPAVLWYSVWPLNSCCLKSPSLSNIYSPFEDKWLPSVASKA